MKLSSQPLTNKYGETYAVKVIYDLKNDKLYFINSKYYKFHHQFCSEELFYRIDLNLYNRYNYSKNNPKQRFLLANLNYSNSNQTYSIELSPIDLMETKNIVKLFTKIKQSFYNSNALKFTLSSVRLMSIKHEISKQIPIITPSELYRDLNFQSVSKYRAKGHLKYISDLETQLNSIKPTDIIILKETPLILPQVAGIIVAQFQTPLSHLTILGRNRKIPIMANKTVFSDSSILKLNNKPVELIVQDNTYRLKQLKTLNVKSEKNKLIKLDFSLLADSLIDMKYIDKKSNKNVGNKAANFGELYKLSKTNTFKVPEHAFAIPFSFYYQHIKGSKAQLLINQVILNREILIKTGVLKQRLTSIRKAILEQPINSELIALIQLKICEQDKYKRFRFRSSTNAEDAKGFSGAGLYTSKTGIIGDKNKSVELAVKKVWASLWNLEAFLERELYHIDHNCVFMGVLVHRSFPTEQVNGVAITKNIYRKKGYGFVVNAQKGNENVVKPRKGIINDQFICYPNKTNFIYNNAIDIISQSNINGSKLVMKEQEILNLANCLHQIKKHYYSKTSTLKRYIDFGLDIEFKIDGPNRDLYIKQVRLYND